MTHCTTCGRTLPDEHAYRVKLSIDAVFDLSYPIRKTDRVEVTEDFLKGVITTRIQDALEDVSYVFGVDINSIMVEDLERID